MYGTSNRELHILSPVPTTGLKVKSIQRKTIVGSCLDKIPLPEPRRPSMREVLDFDAILSGPICFFPLNESLCNKDPQDLLFAANKEPPCQKFLKLELGMKKYEKH